MPENNPQRRPTRLKSFNYNDFGCYFVTLCTKDRQHILGDICVGHDDPGVPLITLYNCGKIVEKYLLSINETHDDVRLEKYVIMPNHVHAILCIKEPSEKTIDQNGVPRSSRPTNRISGVVGCLKRLVNKSVGRQIWQTSFYDHIIRNDQDYARIWEYIDANPFNWLTDEYYN